MTVGKNSEYALQQAFHKVKGHQQQYLWLDAICIDQSHDSERAHQVALMGQLYEKATQIFACVGPHSDDSECIARACNRNKRMLNYVASRFGRLQASGRNDFDYIFALDHDKSLTLASIIARVTLTPLQLRLAFVMFLSRDYFSRVWILQELYMGSAIVYCCGDDYLQAHHMLALSQLLEFCFDLQFRRGYMFDVAVKYTKRVSKTVTNFFEQLHHGYPSHNLSSMGPQLNCLALASEPRRLRRLGTTLHYNIHFQCADAHDKVYGVLSLVDWPKNLRPIPDYGKDIFVLATEVSSIITMDDSEKSSARLRAATSLKPRLGVWPWRMCNIFGLSPTHSFAESIIAVRTEPFVVPDGFTHLQEDRPLLLEICLWAAEIRSTASEKTRDVMLHCSEPKAEDEMVVLFSSPSVPWAKAPLDTRAGDWYLELNDKNGPIIRSSQSSRYTIIGAASREDPIDRRGLRCPSGFRIYWDPQDALLFYVFICEMEDPGRRLRVRVCRAPGSSFAVEGARGVNI